MGKLKTKYPVEITIQFFLFLENEQVLREAYLARVDSGPLLYSHVHEQFSDFLINNGIHYEAYMFFQTLHSEEEELMLKDWTISINEIEDRGRYIMIRVKSHTQHVRELICEELAQLNSRIAQLQNKVNILNCREAEQLLLPAPAPALHHNSSLAPPLLPDKDLDIGILFSEPIFDEKKHKEANMPVDFRSEIQRLYSALNNSYKPQITVECQIGTKQHLKHLIGLKKPKILHIICHGSKEGELEFEDDSKFALGSLCTIDTAKIREILLSQKESIPKLVFVNSCYSELIGKVFFEAGAQYVIMIDSQDKIDDEAAQIFSENFYRNIFRGEKVGFSFKQAKDTVGIKHNSFGCCCRHTSREKHKSDCRWLSIVQEMGDQQAHKLYHMPSEKCSCELRNLNRHKLTCDWARFALFHINKDFRIKGSNGEEYFPKKISELPNYLPNSKKELMICCCFNFDGESKEARIPHSECNKFKMLPAEEDVNEQPLYQLQKNVNFRTQIIDYSAPELTEYHEKVQNSSVMGRQQELYEFMKKIKDPQLSMFFLYGHSGVGKTSFSIKTATYLIQRRIYQIYFFIDLYDIKDRDMFRNKFNEVTKFGYPSNRNSLNEVRGKPMLIIFDNADEFFMQSMIDFKEELQGLRKEIFHTKFIITCKEKNFAILQTEDIIMSNSYVKELKVLDENVAARALFSKIRNYLDISIEYMDIRGLIANKQELQIPKVIENLSHSFSNLKTKLKLGDLRKKIEQLGAGDLAFNKLVGQNLSALKSKCKQSYEMLIFISQFSQGIDKNDFNILSMYDRNDNNNHYKDRLDYSIDIPIDKHWKRRLAVLFERYQNLEQSEITKDSETESMGSQTPTFDRHTTSWDVEKEERELKELDDNDAVMFKGESYFLEELSRNRFIVKRFIRDFIWNKDKSDENFYMKHIFVAYTAVMLDIYLKFLVEERYIHEEILEYSDISMTGIFKYKDNNYNQASLTESIRYVEEYNSKFERILKEQPALRERIKSSDPSVFILNHKLDFLHIYGYDWSKVYDNLLTTRKKQASILINYLQRLIVLIPTALKIANVEDSLIQYSIRQSIQLLAQIRRYSKPSHTLLLTLKLKLMKAGHDLQKGQTKFFPSTDFQREFHKNDLEQISSSILNVIQKQFGFQVEILTLYDEYIQSKDLKKSSEQSLKAGSDKLIEIIKQLQIWVKQEQQWTNTQNCEILHAKRHLIMAMIYNKVLEMSTKYISNYIIINFKKQMTFVFIDYADSAARQFIANGMIKLALRAKLIGVSIGWEAGKYRAKQNEFNKDLENERQKLRECEEIFEDKKNNLIGLTYFDILIKKIKKEMKEKMWQESANSFIFMKAVPLANKQSPILEHIVRKKPKYRKDLENMLTTADIDISLKFQILTSEKLEEESKKGCTILLLNTNVKIENGRVFLVFEGSDLKEKYVEINNDFVQKYPVLKAKLFILMGNNAYEGVKKLSQLIKTPPSMISVTSSSSGEFDQFEELNYEDGPGDQELKKMIEHSTKTAASQIEMVKQLVKGLIDMRNSKKGIREIYEQIRSQFSEELKQIKVDIIENKEEIVRMVKGGFKDLSPGYRKAHNIDLEFKGSTQLIYRKWKEINEVFRELNTPKEPKYIHICGGNGVGKTTFLEQIGRMFVERGMFQSGVYIINGKQVQQKYQSDFQAYILKNSQTGNIFNLQSFNKYANSKFMLMIDDFHLIKPRSNGRYNIFINRLIDKNVNLLISTHETFNIRDTFPTIRTIRIEKLNPTELNIYAYHILDLNNPAQVQDYDVEKLKRRLNVQDILRIQEKYRLQRTANSNSLRLPQEELKRMVSNRS